MAVVSSSAAELPSPHVRIQIQPVMVDTKTRLTIFTRRLFDRPIRVASAVSCQLLAWLLKLRFKSGQTLKRNASDVRSRVVDVLLPWQLVPMVILLPDQLFLHVPTKSLSSAHVCTATPQDGGDDNGGDVCGGDDVNCLPSAGYKKVFK